MATEPTTVNPDPFHDPFDDIPSIDISSFFPENSILEPLEFPLNFADPQPLPESNDLLDSENPLSDPVIWALCKETHEGNATGNNQAGPSRLPGESSGHGFNGNSVFGDDPSLPVSVFSASRSQKNCTCCQKLRVITHINGMNVKRLEIHGRLGIITHAVLEKYDFYSCFENQDLQMFDFRKESSQSVKRFLVQYFETCKQEGYSNMMQDPLSTFYEALCVGLNEDDNPDDFLQFSADNSGDCENYQPEMWRQSEPTSNKAGQTKIPLATQRARTGKLRLEDFIEYFEFPIEVAAQKLNICPTVMKKICRRNGVGRWPYRKIKSIKSKIAKKIEISAACHGEEKAQAMADIEMHQQELADIYNAFTQ